jgi:hypothetical protein
MTFQFFGEFIEKDLELKEELEQFESSFEQTEVVTI